MLVDNVEPLEPTPRRRRAWVVPGEAHAYGIYEDSVKQQIIVSILLVGGGRRNAGGNSIRVA